MKQWILSNLINRANKLNSKKLAWLSQDIKDTIIILTPFLPEKTLLKERMYCILKDVDKRQCCEFCGNPRRFIHARNIYVETCGSHVCSAKLRIKRYGILINKK